MSNFNFMYVMKKILLTLIVFCALIETTYSQDFLGKNKVLVKKEMQKNKGNGKVNDIKSFGYEACMYTSYPYNSDILYTVFNNKGVCFLECIITDKKFADKLLYHYCNKDNFKVYQINPSVNKEHEFIAGKTTVELVVVSNDPTMINASYNFYFFNSNNKQDVLNYFEKKFSKEYAKIKEKEEEEERQRQAELERQKEVVNILSTINRNKIEKEVYNYYESKLLKESEYWDVLEKPKKEEINIISDVLIYHTDSLHTEIVRIDKDILDNKLNTFYWEKAWHNYCKIDGVSYSKYQNSFFCINKIDIKTKSLEKGIYGVEKKKDKFKYYKTVPNEVQEWCKNNITKNGFHAIQYTNYGGEYTIKLINVTKDVRKILQRKDMNL